MHQFGKPVPTVFLQEECQSRLRVSSDHNALVTNCLLNKMFYIVASSLTPLFHFTWSSIEICGHGVNTCYAFREWHCWWRHSFNPTWDWRRLLGCRFDVVSVCLHASASYAGGTPAFVLRPAAFLRIRFLACLSFASILAFTLSSLAKARQQLQYYHLYAEETLLHRWSWVKFQLDFTAGILKRCYSRNDV